MQGTIGDCYLIAAHEAEEKKKSEDAIEAEIVKMAKELEQIDEARSRASSIMAKES